MGLGGFFKTIGGAVKDGVVGAGKGVGKAGVFIAKHADEALPLLQLVGVPIPGLQIIKAAMVVAEAKGGKNKVETAIAEILPALQAEGINVPIKKIRLAMELLLDQDTDGMVGEDEVWTFNVESEAAELKARAGLLDEAAASGEPTASFLVKAAGKAGG